MKGVASNEKERKITRERNLKDLRKKKNMAKKDLRQAKHHPDNEEAHELSVKFQKLLRLYNKVRKTSLKARMNSETFESRKES